MILKSPKSIPILHSCNLPQKQQTSFEILRFFKSINFIRLGGQSINQSINQLSFSSTNFSRFFVFRFTFFVLFTFAFSFFTVNYGQVKIKEKVEIKPTPNAKVKGYSSSNTSNFFPCGPFISDQNGELWQVVWLGSTYALDLEQQPYNYQRDQENQLNLSRFKYSPSIEILEGFEKCEFREVFKCDSITGECPDPISVNAGVKIMPESMFDITGKGDFTIIQGIPTRITSGYVRYTLRFIKEGDVTIGYTDPFDPETTIRFHTKVVKPDFYLEYTGLGVLPHGEEENDFDVSERPLQCVGFWADGYGLEFWNGGSLPENVKFNVEMLEGTEYAKLIHETFDGEFYNRDTSTSYTGLDGTNYELFLSALGKEPEDTAVVKLRYSTTDNNIPAIEQEVKIVKNPTYPIKVTLTPNELMPGDTAFISLDQRLDSYPYDPYNLEYEPFGTDQLFDIKIEKGSELGTIYSIAASDTSDEFKQLTDGFYFIAKEEINSANTEISIRVRTVVYYFDDLPVTTITAADKIAHAKKAKQNRTAIISFPTSSEDIFGIGRVKIKKENIDHFEITILPDTLAIRDTIAFTETARLIVKAKDTGGNDIELDSTTVLNFVVITNSAYGTFIKPNGDTLKTAPVVLENISYGDAKAGRIRFAAVKANPDSVVKCNIRVELQEDTTKFGEREAVVLEQTLKIVMEGEREVEPIITRHTNDPGHNTYLNNIDLENRKPFRIILTRGNELVRNHRIRLYTNYIDGSGGHDHVTPRRPSDSERIRRQNYGSFYSYSSGANFNVSQLHGGFYERGSQDTVSRFEYVASLWGDSMKIYVKSLENSLLKDSITIIERIPNLELLQQGNDYILIGGTQEHHGPPNYQDNHNHFGTERLTNALREIAEEYSRRHSNTRIRINDMSLIYGGKFDISGNWRGSHAQHREGRNADISFRGLNNSNDVVNINIEHLTDIIHDVTDLRPLLHYPPDPPHFHIYTN